jgi:endonuclease/exonuclease/phosphatase family metal-dependent hydrolase
MLKRRSLAGCGLIAGLILALGAASGSAGAERPVGAGSAGAAVLDVATLNFCNHTCRDYQGRLHALRNTIRATRPAILALQEVATRDGYLARVERILAPLGYRNANPFADEQCDATCEAHVFVRTDIVEVLGVQPAHGTRSEGGEWAGILPMSDVDPAARGNPASFAFLRHRASGAEFLAVSLHFEKQNGTDGHGPDDRARNAAAAGLARWTRQRSATLGKPGLPTVLLGDFNTYLRKHPRGAEWVLMQQGFRNADRARVRVGVHYPTVNKYPLDARWNGFPPRPRSFVDGGPKIDKIMTRGTGRALRHEIYIRKQPDGQFDERFRSSDHNLVRATIPIGR